MRKNMQLYLVCGKVANENNARPKYQLGYQIKKLNNNIESKERDWILPFKPCPNPAYFNSTI